MSERTLIIAEAGVNHNGSLEIAKELVDAAADAGADAIKFQTFKAVNLVTTTAQKATYQLGSTDAKESQLEMLQRLELDFAAHHILKKLAETRGILFLSTPFDLESLNFLIKEIDVPFIKIPSGEITNAPFLHAIGQSQKPVIMSTGMSSLGEIEDALGVLIHGYLGEGNPSLDSFRRCCASKIGQEMAQEKVSLLHCTTEYPAPFDEVNLRAMDTMRHAFGLPVGLSDHTVGIAVAIAAVARGATIIEKHFTIDRTLPGPDHATSLNVAELKEMVKSVRQVEEALGIPLKVTTTSEYSNQGVARKSLVASASIAMGQRYTIQNISAKRPGTGVSPMLYWDIIGRQSNKNYQEDDCLEL